MMMRRGRFCGRCKENKKDIAMKGNINLQHATKLLKNQQ